MEAGHCHPPQQRPGPTGTARCLPSPAPVSGQRPPGPTATANPSPVPSLRASPNPAAAAALTAPGCARRAPPRPPGPGSSARSAPGSGRAPLGRWLPAGGGSVGRLRARPGRASAPAPGQRGGCCGREAVCVLCYRQLPSQSEPHSVLLVFVVIAQQQSGCPCHSHSTESLKHFLGDFHSTELQAMLTLAKVVVCVLAHISPLA